MDNRVRRNRLPIYITKSNGTVVEFSDSLGEATGAFEASAATTREIFKLHQGGWVTCVRRNIRGRELI